MDQLSQFKRIMDSEQYQMHEMWFDAVIVGNVNKEQSSSKLIENENETKELSLCALWTLILSKWKFEEPFEPNPCQQREVFVLSL